MLMYRRTDSAAGRW